MNQMVTLQQISHSAISEDCNPTMKSYKIKTGARRLKRLNAVSQGSRMIEFYIFLGYFFIAFIGDISTNENLN
jgi:hypothetical protein